MSGNLFTNTDKELQRMEILLRKLRNYNLATSEHKSHAMNGKESNTYYYGTVIANKYTGESIRVQIDTAESFPELFEKISDQLETLLK